MYIDLRRLTGQPCEMGALQKVLEGAPSYAKRVTGHPPEGAEARRLFSALPPGVPCDNKYLYGVMAGEHDMIGCADVIRGWPTPSTALIGLLLLTEMHQGCGVGRCAYHLVEAKVQRWPEIDVLRISVVCSLAAVLPFWRRLGFAETGEVQPYRYDTLVSESIILTKSLRDDDRPPDPAS